MAVSALTLLNTCFVCEMYSSHSFVIVVTPERGGSLMFAGFGDPVERGDPLSFLGYWKRAWISMFLFRDPLETPG